MPELVYPAGPDHGGNEAAAEQLKVPPHSVKAEQSIIGGLMLENAAWDQVADLIVEDDFYRYDHRMIFRAIGHLADHAKPFDVVTLSEWLETREELDKVGGLAYLGSLAKDTPSSANIKAYAGIVRERSILRQLISVGSEIADDAFNPDGRDSAELLDNAESKVFKIAEKGARGQEGFAGIKHLLTKAVDRIDTLFQQEDGITGLSTGFTDFDEKTSGLQKGDMVIVAGRPSMGKTSFAMNIVENSAISTGLPIAVFSMEMPGEALAMRMLSSVGRIDAHKVRTGKLSDEDWPKLTHAVGVLAEASIYIDDTPALSPNELRAKTRRLSREAGNLGMIVIDYLQLMQVPSNKENRTSEISEISRSLKGLAKEMNCPVVALSQLNRSLEQRPNKRPIMSDLRESGAIEQDADLIVFIYRDEVYNEDTPDKGIAEIIIAKQRNGPIGTVRQTFIGQYTRFEDYISSVYNNDDY